MLMKVCHACVKLVNRHNIVGNVTVNHAVHSAKIKKRNF